jgi:Predicted 3'-5' exonuclease related to the exonuclease domain of PolB
LAVALGIGQKTGDGCQVADWWAVGDLEAIASYCRADVRLSYKVYNRLMFLDLPDRFAALERSRINTEPVNA